VNIHVLTARLTIRQFTHADEDNLVSLNSDPEVMRYLNAGPSRDEIRDEVIPFHLAAYERHPGFGTWAAEDIGTGEFLGWFHLRPRRADGAIDLGYRLRRALWGNGYATEGSRALIDKGFTEHSIDRVVSETMTINLASRRVMEKCGLIYLRTYFDDETPDIEGADQGNVEYQLTRTGWETASRGRAAGHRGRECGSCASLRPPGSGHRRRLVWVTARRCDYGNPSFSRDRAHITSSRGT
jgi:RimJ/RimL family protein N-acetyltransferase